MHRRMPPFTAVRAFEAVARRLSISAAARELFVSTSAVSQQIKVLEDHLGVQLFERSPSRGLTLTAAGRTCAPPLQSILDSLAHVFDQVDSIQGENTVTLLASPSLAGTWLAPRMRRFLKEQPNISIRMWVNRGLLPSNNPIEHDLAIYYGEGPFHDLRVDQMMTETVFPVYSPALHDVQPIRVPNDIANHTLLHDDTLAIDRNAPTLGFPNWAAWLAFAGVTSAVGTRSHRVEMSQTVQDFAAEGVGVALARSCIVQHDLESGRLIRPLAIEYPRRFNYYVVSNSATGRRAVSVVRDWLLEEGHTTSVALDRDRA